MANGNGRRKAPRIDADLEACVCVDGGHFWDRTNAIFHRKGMGALAGIVVRTMTCLSCGSSKDQPLTWDGRLAGGTVYDLSDVYIDNARLLDEDMHERARVYRRVLLERVRIMDAAELQQSA